MNDFNVILKHRLFGTSGWKDISPDDKMFLSTNGLERVMGYTNFAFAHLVTGSDELGMRFIGARDKYLGSAALVDTKIDLYKMVMDARFLRLKGRYGELASHNAIILGYIHYLIQHDSRLKDSKDFVGLFDVFFRDFAITCLTTNNYRGLVSIITLAKLAEIKDINNDIKWISKFINIKINGARQEARHDADNDVAPEDVENYSMDPWGFSSQVLNDASVSSNYFWNVFFHKVIDKSYGIDRIDCEVLTALSCVGVRAPPFGDQVRNAVDELSVCEDNNYLRLCSKEILLGLSETESILHRALIRNIKSPDFLTDP